MDEPRIYWAARNFHSSLWWSSGNHHFILIRTLRPIGIFSPVLHNGDGFITLGAVNVNDVVTFRPNHQGDVDAFKRIISQAPNWESCVFAEKRRVSRGGRNFAEQLAQACMKFRSN